MLNEIKKLNTCPCGVEFFRPKHPNQKRCSLACYHKYKDREYYKEVGLKARGRTLSLETRKNMSIAQQKLVLERKNNFWNGGVSTDRQKLRRCFEMKIWREEVFKRDNFTCQFCNKRGNGILHADHIKSFSELLDEIIMKYGLENIYENGLKYEPMWDISNGRTLCFKCHTTTDSYGINHKYYQSASMTRAAS